MSDYKPYSGIGSRQTPKHILEIMTKTAEVLATRGFTLRSGGAGGADTAFEAGAGEHEIYLPWPKFQGSSSQLIVQPGKAFNIASEFHPTWDRCSQGARKLHARNVHQVLGMDFNHPSKFVLCWTPDGCTGMATRTRKTGGTGMAISIAEHYGIPVFNLMLSEHYDRLSAIIA